MALAVDSGRSNKTVFSDLKSRFVIYMFVKMVEHVRKICTGQGILDLVETWQPFWFKMVGEMENIAAE